MTGGLLSANSPEQRLKLAGEMFYLLAKLDWKNCLIDNVCVNPFQRLGCEGFLEMVENRTVATQLYKQAQQFVGKMVALGKYDNQDQGMEAVLGAAATHKFLGKSYVSKIRCGRRWTELSVLLGSDEIVLLVSPSQMSILDGTTQKSAISRIVLMGSDDDFGKLKKLLSTRWSWVAEVCGRLRGLLPLILETGRLRKIDKHRTKSLATKIANRVARVFGGPKNDIRMTESGTRPSSVVDFILKIVFVLWNTYSDKLRQIFDGPIQYQRLPVLQFLVMATTEFGVMYSNHVLERKENFSDESVRKHFIQSAKPTLLCVVYEKLVVKSRNEVHVGNSPHVNHNVARWKSNDVITVLRIAEFVLEMIFKENKDCRTFQAEAVLDDLLEGHDAFERSFIIVAQVFQSYQRSTTEL